MKIGILGGGQLARMLALAGIPLGHEFVFFEPASESCAAVLGQHIQAQYNDEAKLKQFAESVDVVTYEFENVPVAAVEYIETFRHVYPSVKALKATQDRFVEKNMFANLGMLTAKFVDIQSRADIDNAISTLGLPLVLKSRLGGYDGKGQHVVKSADQVDDIWQDIAGIPFIAEQWMQFSREISIIAVRNQTGDIQYYDVAENVHKNGILHTSHNKTADNSAAKAREYAKQLLTELDYTGILTIEFFDTEQGLVVNEFAPRVHNSGHWTIEGAVCSQFENHIRAVANSPLGSCESRGVSCMLNFIGELPAANHYLSQANSHFHDYNKKPKPGRKVGHATLVASTELDLAKQVSAFINQG